MAAEKLSSSEKVQAYSQEAVSLLLALREQRPPRVQPYFYELTTPLFRTLLLSWDHSYQAIDPLLAREDIFRHLLRSAGQPSFPLKAPPEVSLIAYEQSSLQRFNAYQINLYTARFHNQQSIYFEHLHVDVYRLRHHHFRYPYATNPSAAHLFLARHLAALRSFFNPIWD